MSTTRSITVGGLQVGNLGFSVGAKDGSQIFNTDSINNKINTFGELFFNKLTQSASSNVADPLAICDNFVICHKNKRSRKMTFDCSQISDDEKRTLTMPDFNVDLSFTAGTFLSNQGDLLTRTDSTLARIPIGVSETFLKSNGTTPIYSNSIDRINQNLLSITVATEYQCTSTTPAFLRAAVSAGNDVVKLPDATTLPLGWTITIANNCNNEFDIILQDFTGTIVHTIGEHSDTTTHLIGNDDAGGHWHFEYRNTTHVLSVGPHGGEYTSISEAMASIIDSSSANRYILHVSPGVYTEPPIIMKPYVEIASISRRSVTITAQNVTDTVITGSTKGILSGLQITGATNGTGVYIDYSETFEMHECEILDCKIGVHVINTSANPSNRITMYNCIFQGDHETSVWVDGPGSINSMTVRTFHTTVRGHANTTRDYLCDSGGTIARAILICTDDVLSGYDSPGTAIYATDGAYVILNVVIMQKYDTMIHIPNIGQFSIFSALNTVVTTSTTNDVLIEHPNTSGSITGIYRQSRCTIPPSMTVSIVDSDPSSQGYKIVGDLYMGPCFTDITEVSTLIRKGASLGNLSGGVITENNPGASLDIDVTSGVGYVDELNILKKVIYSSNTTFTLPDNSVNYIYVNSSGVLQYASSRPDDHTTLLLSRVLTKNGIIEFIDNSSLSADHCMTKYDAFVRDVHGSLYSTGSLLQFTAPNQFEVATGRYYYANVQFNPTGKTLAGNFVEYYHSSSNWTLSTTNTINTTQYDDNANLVAIASGNVVRHSVYIVGDGIYEKYLVVIAQAEYANSTAAKAAVLPTPPTYFEEGVALIGSIIIQEGLSPNAIIEVTDERSLPTTQVSSTATVTDHGSLSNLLQDNHTQYLLANGTRAMSGNLQMGTSNINFTTPGTGVFDTVTVADHSARHLPNGSDSLTTAAPDASLGNASTNTVGNANSLARSNHTHALDIASINSALSHSTLTNLSADDHPQYLLIDGSRAMTGDLDLNSNDINSVNILTTTATATTVNTETLNVEDSGSAFKASIQAPTLTSDYSLTLPVDGGNLFDVLQSNGSGALSWTSRPNNNYFTIAGGLKNIQNNSTYAKFISFNLSDQDGITMPFNCTVVAVSVKYSHNVTINIGLGESVTFIAGIWSAGTRMNDANFTADSALTTQLQWTNANSGTYPQSYASNCNMLVFAGQSIGFRSNKIGSVSPSGMDAIVTMWLNVDI